MTDHRSLEVAEARKTRRFAVYRPLAGQFAGTDVDVVDLGSGGMQLEHSNPFRIGSRGIARVAIDQTGESLALPALVVWSQLSQAVDPKGRFRYRSGVRFEDLAADVLGALGRLIRAYGRADTDSLERKRNALAAKLEKRRKTMLEQPIILTLTPADNGHAALIAEARAYFDANPELTGKWFNRARFALAGSPGDRALPYRQDVIAIWEYLERRIDVALIAATFERQP
jgi:hypothetical protein